MPKQDQSQQIKHKKAQKARIQAEKVADTKPPVAEVTAVEEMSVTEPLTLSRHAQLLNRPNLTNIQRQAIAKHIGQIGGNRHLTSVMRSVDTVQRHASTPLEYEEGSIQAQRIQRHASAEHDQALLQTKRGVIQRHASTPLEYEEGSIQAKLLIQRDARTNTNFIDKLNDELDKTSVSAQAIFDLADDATTTDANRTAAVADPRLRAKMVSNLDGADQLTAFKKLKAKLRILVDVAVGSNASGSDIVALISAETNAARRQEVLADAALMTRLRAGVSGSQAYQALTALNAPVAERLRMATEGWGYDSDGITAMLTAASPLEKANILRDDALLAQLTAELSNADMLAVLRQIGASLVDRLYHLVKTDNVENMMVTALLTTATDEDKAQILGDANLIQKLGEGLSNTNAIAMMETLGVSLADRLRIAGRGWGTDEEAINRMVIAASEAERMSVYADSQLMAYLREELTESEFRQTELLLRFGSQDAIDNASEDQLNSTDLPDNLTAKVSDELDKEASSAAKILADINAATEDDKALVRLNRGLMARIEATLPAADVLSISAALGDSIVNRLNLMLSQGSSGADLVTAITTATADDKEIVKNNRDITLRLIAAMTPAEASQFRTAIGDTVANRMRQAVEEGQAAAQLLTLIESATPAERTMLQYDSTILSLLSGAYTAMEYWQMRLRFEYGTVAGYPPKLTDWITAWTADGSYAAVRRSMVNITTAEFDALKNVVGIRDILRQLVTVDAEYLIILRTLEQGFISEETDVTGAVPEVLRPADPTTGIFTPRAFQGTRGYDVAYLRDRMQVDIRIQIAPQDAQAITDQPTYSSSWESSIEAAWDNKYKLRNPNHDIPIRINCHFTPNDPHHTVKVGSQLTPTWPAYNEFNWFYRATNYSAMAPLHEFGHMLGNADEYMLAAAAYTGTVGSNPVTDVAAGNANASAPDPAGNINYSTNTVMGNNPGAGGGSVEKRHLNDFTNWMNTNRRKNADGTFFEPAFNLV